MNRILSLIAKIDRNDKAPEWMLLFAAGWGELADGVKFLVDQEAFKLVKSAIEARGNEVVFDYEHQTLKDMPAPAAGWIKELAWQEGVGIKARVEWTEAAAQFIAKGEYRYFSPVFYVRKSDQRVCGLHSSALTNTPKTNHLTPILAKLEAGLDNNKEKSMDREQLIAALGLKDDATDVDILAAIAKQAGVAVPKAEEKEVVSKAVITALGLDGTANESTVVASINVLKQEKATGVSIEDFNAMKEKMAVRDATDAVDKAIAKGKVTPDQKDWAFDYAQKDPEGFAVYVTKAPQVVPVDDLPGGSGGGGDKSLDEATLAVAKQMDVDPGDLEKDGE